MIEPGFIIDREKLTGYLLDPFHPHGGPKCRVFLLFGFRIADPQELGNSLLEHGRNHYLGSALQQSYPYGRRLIAEGVLETPSGRTPWARTVWEEVADGSFANFRLITAYIREPPKS